MLCHALERQNHARELISEISLHEWDGVVIVSGDGLLHEVPFIYVSINVICSKPKASTLAKGYYLKPVTSLLCVCLLLCTGD